MIIPIDSAYDLPDRPCRHYDKHGYPMDEEGITKVFEKEFGREPEVIYSHKTGLFIPVTVDEFQQVKATLFIHVPGERPE